MYDVKRLQMYCRNLVDYHLIVDLIPTLARLYFLQKMGDINLSAAQAVSVIFVGIFIFLILVNMKYSLIFYENPKMHLALKKKKEKFSKVSHI